MEQAVDTPKSYKGSQAYKLSRKPFKLRESMGISINCETFLKIEKESLQETLFTYF